MFSIENGELDRFRRHPEVLAEYFKWKDNILLSYPNVEAFVLAERLHWTKDNIEPKNPKPFTDPCMFQKLHLIYCGFYILSVHISKSNEYQPITE